LETSKSKLAKTDLDKCISNTPIAQCWQTSFQKKTSGRLTRLADA